MRHDGKRLIGKWAAYTLYGLLAGLVFLYLLFPFKRLEQFAIARVAEATSLQLVPQERRLGFPLNVQWQTVRAENVYGTKRFAVEGKEVSLDFALLPLLSRTVSAAYSFTLLGGTVWGTAQWHHDLKPFGYIVRGSARDLALSPGPPGIPAARLRAEWVYRWDPMDILRGQGQLTVEAAGVMLPPVPGAVPSLALRRMTARIILNNGVGIIEELRGEADGGAMRGAGTVMLRPVLKESLVNLNVELRPRDGVPSHVMITGPLRSPSVFANGVLVSSPAALL